MKTIRNLITCITIPALLVPLLFSCGETPGSDNADPTLAGNSAMLTENPEDQVEDAALLEDELFKGELLASGIPAEELAADISNDGPFPADAQINAVNRTRYRGVKAEFCARFYLVHAETGEVVFKRRCFIKEAEGYGECLHPNRHLRSSTKLINKYLSFNRIYARRIGQVLESYKNHFDQSKFVHEYKIKYRRLHLHNLWLAEPCVEPRPVVEETAMIDINLLRLQPVEEVKPRLNADSSDAIGPDIAPIPPYPMGVVQAHLGDRVVEKRIDGWKMKLTYKGYMGQAVYWYVTIKDRRYTLEGINPKRTTIGVSAQPLIKVTVSKNYPYDLAPVETEVDTGVNGD